MTLPALLFGVLVSTLFGASFHLWKNGGFTRLVLYLFLGWIGFWAGHIAGAILHLTFISIGSLNLGMAGLGSFTLLFVGHWLSMERVD